MSLWSKAKGVFGRIAKPLVSIAAKFGTPIGAALGSIVPGAGTAAGAAIGGAVQSAANAINKFIN